MPAYRNYYFAIESLSCCCTVLKIELAGPRIEGRPDLFRIKWQVLSISVNDRVKAHYVPPQKVTVPPLVKTVTLPSSPPIFPCRSGALKKTAAETISIAALTATTGAVRVPARLKVDALGSHF